MSNLSSQLIDERLAQIREGLEVDGYELAFEPGEEQHLLRVIATENACEDCLVPKDIFLDIVGAALEGHVAREQLSVIYPGETSADSPGPGGATSAPAVALSSPRLSVADWDDMQRAAEEHGWTDGLPVVPPTADRVERFLAAASLEPGEIVAEAAERNVVFTAESVAANVVMAGGKPEHLPVIVAAVRAVCDPKFKFNHLASLGSPWPLFLVSGPIVERLGLNSDLYLFGTDSPVNAQLSRGFSLALRNIAYARNGGIQRGQWGNPIRWQSFIGEHPTSPWGPMHTDLGFNADQSVLTAASVEPGAPYQLKTSDPDPEKMLQQLCEGTVNWGAVLFCRGTYVVLIGPHQAEWLHDQGWSRADVRQYVLDNTKTTVAALKRRDAWGDVDDMPDDMMPIKPGDEQREVYLFKENPEHDRYIWIRSAMEDREFDVRIMVCGGDAGRRFSVAIPYEFSTNSVSVPIE